VDIDIPYYLRSILPLKDTRLTATAWHTTSQVATEKELELELLELAKVAVAVAVVPLVLHL